MKLSVGVTPPINQVVECIHSSYSPLILRIGHFLYKYLQNRKPQILDIFIYIEFVTKGNIFFSFKNKEEKKNITSFIQYLFMVKDHEILFFEFNFHLKSTVIQIKSCTNKIQIIFPPFTRLFDDFFLSLSKKGWNLKVM